MIISNNSTDSIHMLTNWGIGKTNSIKDMDYIFYIHMFPIKSNKHFKRMISWLPSETRFIFCTKPNINNQKSLQSVYLYHKRCNKNLDNFLMLNHWTIFRQRGYKYTGNCLQFKDRKGYGLLTSGLQMVSLASFMNPKNIHFHNFNLYYPHFNGYRGKPHSYKLDKDVIDHCVKKLRKNDINIRLTSNNPDIRKIVENK